MKQFPVLAASIIALLISGLCFGLIFISSQSGAINPLGSEINTNILRTNVYSSRMASSSITRLLAEKIGRKDLLISNTGGGAATVRVLLVSTSTGYTATSGVPVASGASYALPFNYEGEVWVITDSGTSTIEAQETSP